MPTPLPSATSDAKKPVGPRIMLAAAICVGVLVLLFGMFSKPPPPRPVAEPPPSARAAPVRAKPAFTRWMLASSILELNSTNEIAVDQETKGENRFLLGTVAMVRTDVVTGDPMLMFGSIPFVRASFKGAATPPDLTMLGKLQAGDLVGLRCTGRGKVALSISFDECEVVWLAKADDSLAVWTNYQLCFARFLEGEIDLSNAYFVKKEDRPDGGWLPPAALSKLRDERARIEKRMSESKVRLLDCETPSLWATYRCEGEKKPTPECESPQMRKILSQLK